MANYFPSNHLVTKLVDGEGTRVALSDLAVGDLVATLDLQSQQTEPKSVTAVHSGVADNFVVVHVAHEGSEEIVESIKTTIDAPWLQGPLEKASYDPLVTKENSGQNVSLLDIGNVLHSDYGVTGSYIVGLEEVEEVGTPVVGVELNGNDNIYVEGYLIATE